MLGWLIYVWIDIGVTITQVVLHALGNPSQLYGQHMSLPTFILNQFVNLDQIQYIRDMYNAHYSIYNMFIHMIYKDYLEWVTFSLENIASSKVINYFFLSFPLPAHPHKLLQKNRLKKLWKPRPPSFKLIKLIWRLKKSLPVSRGWCDCLGGVCVMLQWWCDMLQWFV